MDYDILKMVRDLKGIKVTASLAESELGFSNGLLGKAASGKSKLSEERLNQFKAFYEGKMGVAAPTIIPNVDESDMQELVNTIQPFGASKLGVSGIRLVNTENLKDEKGNKVEISPVTEVAAPAVQEPSVVAKKAALPVKDTQNDTFDSLLRAFHALINDNQSVALIKAPLLALKDKAIRSSINGRQKEAVAARCDNYINGKYGISHSNQK